MLGLQSKPRKEFIDWAEKELEPNASPLKFSSSSLVDSKQSLIINERIKGHVTSNENSTVTIDTSTTESRLVDGCLTEIGSGIENYLALLHIGEHLQGKIVISNAFIHTLIVSYQAGLTLQLINCHVANIDIQTLSDSGGPVNSQNELSFVDSNVGTLKLHSRAIKRLEIKGGSVLNIDCPAPHELNPFTGACAIHENVFMPSNRKQGIIDNPQPYRNMRHHLSQMENMQTASRFHSLELSMEREYEGTFVKFLSAIYAGISNYGSSPLRLALMICLIWTICLYLGQDQISLGLAPENYRGWLETITVQDSQIERAVVFASETVFNPLGLFSKQALVIPNTLLMKIAQTFIGVFSAVLITLLILAIRRKFKLQS